ncbi:MarR family winged helix-turn-helix transcriptional regulator [Nocardioides sp. DS6]|uniref:MarR family winged helix-turn-helix transcriptional regulator n=1 Tax=Nocardioides eburneus TaxID=3231482 RepID=A0ABV3SYP0_9ACTN
MSQTRAAALHDLEGEVGVLLRRIKRVIADRAACVHPDLQPGAFHMLIWIAEHGPVRSSALVEEFHVDKGAVSRTLQHLCELGLIDRAPDPADGRAALMSASPDAVRRLREADDQRRAWVQERLKGWSATELAELAAQLGRYNDALT